MTESLIPATFYFYWKHVFGCLYFSENICFRVIQNTCNISHQIKNLITLWFAVYCSTWSKQKNFSQFVTLNSRDILIIEFLRHSIHVTFCLKVAFFGDFCNIFFLWLFLPLKYMHAFSQPSYSTRPYWNPLHFSYETLYKCFLWAFSHRHLTDSGDHLKDLRR